MCMTAILINGPSPFVRILKSPLTEGLHMKFEENWPRSFREVVQGRRRTDDGWQVNRIAHPESVAQMSWKQEKRDYSIIVG